MTPVELVRHAVAVPRSQWWNRDDHLRPLDDDGHRQAQDLVATLRKSPPGLLISSPFLRCRQTLQPFADEQGLQVHDDTDLGEALVLPAYLEREGWVGAAWLGGRALRALHTAVGAGDGVRVALCSHGDVLPALLAALAGRDGLQPPQVRLRKGWRVVLTLSDGRVTAVSQPLAPDAPSPF